MNSSRLLCLMLSATVLSGCYFPQLTGLQSPELYEQACEIGPNPCFQVLKDLKASWTLEPVREGEYQLQGEAYWSNAKTSAVYEDVRHLVLHFVFMGGTRVVHEERVVVRGKEGQALRFERHFVLAAPIGRSELVAFRAQVSESR